MSPDTDPSQHTVAPNGGQAAAEANGQPLPVEPEVLAGAPENPQAIGDVALSAEARAAKITEVVTAPFDGEMPDAFFSFSGGMWQNPKTGKFETYAWNGVSEHGLATGSKTRIVATAEIAKALPDLTIVTNSYNGKPGAEDWPTMAVVVRDELIGRGVNPDKIVMEEDSYSTATQLIEMVNLAVKENWKNLLVMINDYHVPRTSEMERQLGTIIDSEEFQKVLQQFRDGGGKVSFISAETILAIRSPHYVYYQQEVEKSDAFQTNKASEEKGLADLKAGKYHFTLLPKHSKDR